MSNQGKGVSEHLRCETAVVNKEVAKALLESTLFPRQRNLNEQNVERLASEMRRGWYIPGTPLFFAVLPDKNMYLLNGRHSLTAVVQANAVIPFTFIYYNVANEEEAGHIYSRLDLQRVRSWHDAYRAAGFEGLPGFDVNWVNAFGTAIRALLQNFRDGGYQENNKLLLASREVQLRIFADRLPFAKQYVDSLAHKHGKQALPWRRGTLLAVGVELFKYQPAKAYQFFNGASEDNGLLSNDPRKVLLTYLRNITAFSRTQRNLIASAVSLCWNNFYAGGTMRNVYPSSVSSLVIDGTPWNGNYTPFVDLIENAERTVGIFAVDYAEFQTGTMQHKSGEVTRVAHAAKATKKRPTLKMDATTRKVSEHVN